METNLELSQHYRLIEQAIQYIEINAHRQPELDEIASAIGLSEYHFQRLFTRWAGISPKRFIQFLTKEHAKELLARSENLLDTTHQVGLSSLGRLHDLFVNTEAVTPGEYKSHGAGLTIRYGLHPTPFGKCLIATTERGICHLGFVQTSEGNAIDNLVAEWDQAKMNEDYRSTAPLIARIFPDLKLIQLSIRQINASAFICVARISRSKFGRLCSTSQQARLPPMNTSPHRSAIRMQPAQSAQRLGHNPIAFLIPCHRVIRKAGEFGNYRYGSLRKKHYWPVNLA